MATLRKRARSDARPALVKHPPRAAENGRLGCDGDQDDRQTTLRTCGNATQCTMHRRTACIASTVPGRNVSSMFRTVLNDGNNQTCLEPLHTPNACQAKQTLTAIPPQNAGFQRIRGDFGKRIGLGMADLRWQRTAVRSGRRLRRG